MNNLRSIAIQDKRAGRRSDAVFQGTLSTLITDPGGLIAKGRNMVFERGRLISSTEGEESTPLEIYDAAIADLGAGLQMQDAVIEEINQWNQATYEWQTALAETIADLISALINTNTRLTALEVFVDDQHAYVPPGGEEPPPPPDPPPSPPQGGGGGYY